MKQPGPPRGAPPADDANGQSLDLACYLLPGWRPRIRSAPAERDWMEATPDKFAYRCLPLNIANAHGWELLNPRAFEAEWDGGSGTDSVVVRPASEGRAQDLPVSLFGQGVLTFHVEGLFRTPPGFNLWVGGSPNAGKDGIHPLAGVIETDWSPYTFTMNWRFTRPGQSVRFEENEPFCFLFPAPRGLLERFRPRLAPIDEAPELERQFRAWSASRDAFRARVEKEPPSKPAAAWQKLYYRGLDAEGAVAAADHQAKLRLAGFEGAEVFPAPAPPPPSPPAAAAPAPAAAPGEAKLAWVMRSRQRLEALSTKAVLARRSGIDGQTFLNDHYAANWPVVLAGEMEGWPALDRWTPDYLKRVVGDREVDVQADRGADADFERRKTRHTRRMAFGAFIDRVAPPAQGNDVYLTAYNSAANAEALAPLQADLGFIDKLLTRERGMMWIGAAGAFTPLHHDLTNNLFLQVVGRKRMLLVSPLDTPRLYNDQHVFSRIRDLTAPDVLRRFPLLEGLRVHRVDLLAGDVLFIPVGWWHQVLSLDFSVSITHTNFRWPNDFHAEHPDF